DPADVGRMRTRQIGIWTLLWIKANERTGFDHHLAQPVVLFLAPISPDDLLGLTQRNHFGDPIAQLAIRCRTVHFRIHLLSLQKFRAHDCRADDFPITTISATHANFQAAIALAFGTELFGSLWNRTFRRQI